MKFKILYQYCFYSELHPLFLTPPPLRKAAAPVIGNLWTTWIDNEMINSNLNVKIMKTTISILMFLMISLSTFGQESVTFLRNWNTYLIPENITGNSNGKPDWIVYHDNIEIRVVDDRSYSYTYKRNLANKKLPFEIEQSGLSDAVQVEDGYLVGFNRGEWGGGLYWFSKDGNEKEEIVNSLLSGLVQFIKRDNKIYAITGLAHMGMSYGSVIKIEKEQQKWIVEEYLKLPDAPYAIQLDSKDNMLVFTSSGLYSIDKEANLDTLAVKYSQNTDIYPRWLWGFLYPTSMVIQNDVLYVGMRGGVYKFDLATKKEEWLLPE